MYHSIMVLLSQVNIKMKRDFENFDTHDYKS